MSAEDGDRTESQIQASVVSLSTFSDQMIVYYKGEETPLGD